MAYNEKSRENLKVIQKGEVKNPNGRPKLLKNVVKKLPKDMQEKVLGVLAYALTLPDETAAKAYLEHQSGELGEYGFILQIAIKQLLKEGWGFGAMMDILDRLYGKPRQSAEVTHHAEGMTIVVNSKEEMEKLQNLNNLDI